MTQGQINDQIEQAWARQRKLEVPPKVRLRKPRNMRGKCLSGADLVSVIAHAARDCGMLIIRKSAHHRSMYLKDRGRVFKLRISNHAYSEFSKQRHISVILNYVFDGEMDSAEAIAKGRALALEYRTLCADRFAEASEVPDDR